ncbi:MAG: SCP2 sterol-binding domain-containing protein [Acidimicrobiales bacterium]
MPKYAFLSEEWLQAAHRVREELAKNPPPASLPVRMNQIITGVPFGDPVVHAYLDTSAGWVDIATGHLDHPDLTITLDYPTAKAILIDGDAQAAMSAFLAGRIRVDGDVTKLLGLQAEGAAGHEQGAREAWSQLRDITQ